MYNANCDDSAYEYYLHISRTHNVSFWNHKLIQLHGIISKHFSVWPTIKVSRTMIIPNVDVLISFSLDIKLAEYWADETIVEKRRPWLNLPQQVWHLIVIS